MAGGEGAWVGFAGEQYDTLRHWETNKGTAWVYLFNGSTDLGPGLSLDGEQHYHDDHLVRYIPKNTSYDLSLRVDPDGHVPQIQFNDDDVWHDFVPDRVALKAGPWFPFLRLSKGDHQYYHRVEKKVQPAPGN